MSETIRAWHFLQADRMTRYEPRVRIEVGQTLTEDRSLALCEMGLHASIRAIDALRYAPGSVVCRVELSGKVLQGDDKLCASRRTVLAMADASNVLQEFACRCAERALLREREAGREPDPRSWRAIEVKRQCIAGRASDAELSSDYAAAKAAAAEAATYAAAARADYAATYTAAYAAAHRAAYAGAYAAEAAAYAAYSAEAAAEAAAYAAEAAAYAGGYAAEAAFYTYAVETAEREVQNTELEAMLSELLGID